MRRTPQEVADLLGVSTETVLGWIRRGELVATNVSRNRTSKRPSYRISDSSLEMFEKSRQPEPQTKPQRRKRDPNVIQFI